MSGITEIGATALRLWTDLYKSPVPTAVFIREDTSKDDPIVFARYYEANLAWDELLALGFIEDARAIKGKWLDEVEVNTGRIFRMFEISDQGRLAMAMIIATADEPYKN